MKRICFLDEEEREIEETRAGRPLVFGYSMNCQFPDRIPTLVDIHIKDQGGVFFHDPHMIECEGLRGSGYIDVMFDSIPANNQRLLFSISLMGLNTWERTIGFVTFHWWFTGV